MWSGQHRAGGQMVLRCFHFITDPIYPIVLWWKGQEQPSVADEQGRKIEPSPPVPIGR